ncbi:MAG: hypothetical protein ABR881_19780 [Candidatus Sulfotelmatobacter sp.]
MITRGRFSSVFFLPVAAFVLTLLSLAMPAHAQNVQVDLSSTSALCGGQECFNTAGLFNTGTTFLGTSGMDNGNNCTPTAPYTNCPDAYSANQLGLSTTTPPTLTPPSVNVPFTFGTVNTANCGSTGTACIPDVVNFTTSGVVITLPAAQQTIYSTIIILGTAVNGHHSGKVTATYTDGTTNVFSQTLSDWCGFGSNQYESIAVGGINRINSDGTLNGASCNLYAYTYPADFTKTLESITLTDSDGSGAMFALAITLKPPTYTIDGGTANPASITSGSMSTSTVTVNPQPGYVGTIQLSCAISPTIQASSAAKAPSCSLSPASVTVTAGEAAPPTATLTFTSAPPAKAMAQRSSGIFYALWLPVPGLAFVGLGFTSRTSSRKRLFGLFLLGLLAAFLIATPGCVSYKHLGNVGTPPGQYTITVTGLDDNNLSQASNPTGTTNAVTVLVTDN